MKKSLTVGARKQGGTWEYTEGEDEVKGGAKLSIIQQTGKVVEY